MTDPQSLPTSYGYDVLNRLTSLAFNGQSPGFGFGYDALSRRTSLTRPNAVNATYAYDPQSRLTSILHKLGTTTLDGATYTYDNAGNRKTRTDKRLNTTLTSLTTTSISSNWPSKGLRLKRPTAMIRWAIGCRHSA